jgi:hypothetical protein
MATLRAKLLPHHPRQQKQRLQRFPSLPSAHAHSETRAYLARISHHEEVAEVPAFLHVGDALLERIEIDEVNRHVKLVQKLAPVQT